ncbi:DUF6816 family protein [Cylindrospermopsis curvispora]|uniref:DUF6816 family protein n=1 Tax=Cylindrospermopsis curvispora TaxID=747548 RepID=UPI001F2F6418|nr:hypothetical protein [Cylindrospermopsis curvispora]
MKSWNIPLLGVTLVFCLILLFSFNQGEAKAGELAERLADFSHWQKLTSVKPAQGDLIYPQWMKGTWKVNSTLVDLVAPLAPDIISPGFENNRKQLYQPINFLVRFIEVTPQTSKSHFWGKKEEKSKVLVADRVFNSWNLLKAYLGDRAILAVKADPQSPNRQVTFFRGEKQLVSLITDRATERPDQHFITAEVFEQYFKGGSVPYFNMVESITDYHHLPGNTLATFDSSSAANPLIEAEQVTAVYLSPQDPDYFRAGSQPVAVYRYHLGFFLPEQNSKIGDRPGQKKIFPNPLPKSKSAANLVKVE